MSLSAQGVSLLRGTTRALDNVNVDIAYGEVVGVIGPNGAGKSSLLRALSGEWETQGAVRLDGKLTREMDLRTRAGRLAVLPQHSTLDFPFTAREVIAMSQLPHDRPASDERRIVSAVVERFELQALADRIYTTLSGGEKQRIQIARVLCQLWETLPTANFLFDEPTAPLDLSHQLTFVSAMRETAGQGAAVLLVMHDINLAARVCDRIVLLAGGQVLASGTPGEVLDPVTIRQAYGVEVERLERDSGAPAIFAERRCD